jgi:hypothetical protein
MTHLITQSVTKRKKEPVAHELELAVRRDKRENLTQFPWPESDTWVEPDIIQQ